MRSSSSFRRAPRRSSMRAMPSITRTSLPLRSTSMRSIAATSGGVITRPGSGRMSSSFNASSSLHAVIPEAMPEIIPVATPDGKRLILVLRVDADAVPHPVMVSGRVLFRIPGHSVPADRHRVLDLVARDQAARDTEHGRFSVLRIPWQPTEIGIWPEDSDPPRPTGALRVIGGLELPRRVLDRPWLDSAARQAALDALNNSPLRQSPAWSLTTWAPSEPRARHLRSSAAERRQVTAP